jgi:hypothetical protein
MIHVKCLILIQDLRVTNQNIIKYQTLLCIVNNYGYVEYFSENRISIQKLNIKKECRGGHWDGFL